MRKALSWVVGACLVGSPVGVFAASQAAIPASKAAPTAQKAPAADPFTGRTLAYERMEEQYRALEMRARIAKQQYQIARYRQRTGMLGRGAARAAGTAKDSKIARLKERIDALAQVVAKMNAPRKAAPPRRKVPEAVVKPLRYGVVAVIREGGQWTALVPQNAKIGGSLVALRPGARYAGQRVAGVSSQGVRFSGGRWLRIRNVAGVVAVQPVASAGRAGATATSQTAGAGIEQTLRSRLLREASGREENPGSGVPGTGTGN